MLCPKRSGAFVLTTVALTITLGLLAPNAAGATTGHGGVATPANLTPHPWPYDGCSAAPERGPGWDFHHACIHHDGCYRGHWASRRTCDGWFLRDMRASCLVLHPSGVLGRWACDGIAAVYYSAVRLFGAAAYAHRRVDVPVR
ncbi:MAG TPA: phospholipase A2 [Acidimicrobiales bacterium]